jgi:protein-disulfide isomerase
MITQSKLAASLAFAVGMAGFPLMQAQAENMANEDIEKIVHDYILEHPEIIKEAFYVLQEREAAAQAEKESKALSQMSEHLNQSPLDPVGGNPEGTITMVEFFDYNCGYCKRSNATVQALIDANPNLRVVYKEWPILSEASGIAARISLAVHLAAPEKYEDLHRELLNTKALHSDEDIWKVVTSLGIDRSAVEAKLDDPSIDEHLKQTTMLTQQLDITGTPAFIVGDQMLKGAYPVEHIQAAIDDLNG